MASIIASVKRKLAYFLPFASPRKNTLITEEENDAAVADDLIRPSKRQRLNDGMHTPLMTRSFSATSDQQPTSTLESSVSRLSFIAGNSLSLENSSAEDANTHINDSSEPSALLRMLPADVISHCFSYVATKSERFTLQVTCTLFRSLSNANDMLAGIDLCDDWSCTNMSLPIDDGDASDVDDDDDFTRERNGAEHDEDEDGGGPEREGHTGAGVSSVRRKSSASNGILDDSDTGVTACGKLVKFAVAGNIQAVYM